MENTKQRHHQQEDPEEQEGRTVEDQDDAHVGKEGEEEQLGVDAVGSLVHAVHQAIPLPGRQSSPSQTPLFAKANKRKKPPHRKPRSRTYRREPVRISGLVAQQFRKDGRRSRAYRTLVPLSKTLKLPIHHQCERDEAYCVKRLVEKYTSRGLNVLISWQHGTIRDLASALGVKHLVYPKRRYDVLIDIQDRRLNAVTSQECVWLDEDFIGWHGRKVWDLKVVSSLFGGVESADDPDYGP